MKVLVTGAGGFLGRAVVEAASAAGHQVLALVRPSSKPVSAERSELVSGDLRQIGPWAQALDGVDAVVHCAAGFGDFASQLTSNVLATENLLSVLPQSVRRLVHVSSFSVYDFDAPSLGGKLDERTPLERDPLRRDAYTQTKLIQEQLVRAHAARTGNELVVVRPGAIYGPGKDWEFGSAISSGSLDFIFAPFSPMRLIHVDNCADAILAALVLPLEEPLTVNLVDDEQPSHWRYHKLGKRAGVPLGTAIPVPYWMVLALGSSARVASKLWFGGRARLPELLDLPRQRVRWRPLRYANAFARQKLGVQQRVSLQEGVAQIATGLDARPSIKA